jgi:hypothetical protein
MARQPFARPELTFPKLPGATPRYAVAWRDCRLPGAAITRVSGGWRARIGRETADYETLDGAKGLFAELLAKVGQ